jgi:hypothetical protein
MVPVSPFAYAINDDTIYIYIYINDINVENLSV